MAEGAPPDTHRFPFTRLPPDIQYAVCQSLCAHCDNEDNPLAMLYYYPGDETEALMNLCLASRDMRSLAQSILYHFPRVYSYTDFFRTIHARPDLANSVKVQRCIYMDELSRHPSENQKVHYREDIWYLRSLAIELGLDDTELGEFGKTYIDYPEGDIHDVYGTGSFEMRMAFDSLATSITMALCTRLEFLCIDLEDGELYLRSLREWTTRYRYLSGLVKRIPEGRRFLHTLVLQNVLHHDPNMLGLDHVSFLWSLLPNVERLIFFKADYEPEEHHWLKFLVPDDEPRPEYSWKALRQLKELRFLRFARGNLEIPFPAIKRLVSRCTTLEKFIFSPIQFGDNAYPPSRVLDSISSASATLRHLTINCSIREASQVDAKYLLGPELAQFSNLESLILDQAVFCRHHHDPDTTDGSDCLTDILPPNLQNLTLNIHTGFEPLNDIVALGEIVSYGGYPSLAYLRVQMTFEDELWPDTEPRAMFGWPVPPTGRPAEFNRPLLKPRRTRKKRITDAFDNTNVRVEVDFFRRRFSRLYVDSEMMHPISGRYSDARLIDVGG